jgi:type II secretory pathway pseudopilin PulG
MLVVISVLAVLTALVLVALRAARSGAGRAESIASLRALTQAHASYATEHRGRFIPAYVNQSLLTTTIPLTVELADGFAVPEAARQTWVWRLSPYLDHSWRAMFSEADASTMTQLSSLYADRELVEISQQPSFGLNGIFFGGDSDSGGSEIANQSPFGTITPTIAATRITEVRTPSTQVLFAPSRRSGGDPADTLGNAGWFELRAPFLSTRQWEVITDASGSSSIVATSGLSGGTAGLPYIRRNERTFPVAFLDGSAGPVDADITSNDMRAWAPQASGPLWTLP